MVIKLYDAVPSSNCDRVKIVLYEKGLDYETVRIDLQKGEQKTPEFLRLNPYGKVPVLVDDGKVLFESCIINEYLDEKYPNPPLMPNDPYARAWGRVLIDYGLIYLHAPYWALRGEMLKEEAKRDWKVIDQKREMLQGLLQYLEIELADKPYFLGEISLSDIALVTRFFRMESYGALPAPSLPRLDAWLQRMKARPSVRSIHKDSAK